MKGTILLDDDNIIKALLIQHGHAEHVEAPTGAKLPFRYSIVFYAPPFVYAIRHFVGYEDPADNGYRALLIPRDQNTEEEIKEVLNLWLDEGMDKSREDEAYGHMVTVNQERQ